MPKLLMVACGQCVKIALVVGTILSLVNQTPAILHLDFSGEVLVRIGLNYLVPFTVATYSRYSLLRDLEQPGKTFTEVENA